MRSTLCTLRGELEAGSKLIMKQIIMHLSTIIIIIIIIMITPKS